MYTLEFYLQISDVRNWQRQVNSRAGVHSIVCLAKERKHRSRSDTLGRASRCVKEDFLWDSNVVDVCTDYISSPLRNWLRARVISAQHVNRRGIRLLLTRCQCGAVCEARGESASPPSDVRRHCDRPLSITPLLGGRDASSLFSRSLNASVLTSPCTRLQQPSCRGVRRCRPSPQTYRCESGEWRLFIPPFRKES
ncbi:hypothetical protein JOB18_032092 [Solea senegalensis]|uniref:Uncharacterized protein n=1 Tax=Solea senegalensis TaxID=28829 RepID=A0AAV6R8P5_SOLSE|nr:hypothetical protein JOB18_032092 [Solea senegalensis]